MNKEHAVTTLANKQGWKNLVAFLPLANKKMDLVSKDHALVANSKIEPRFSLGDRGEVFSDINAQKKCMYGDMTYWQIYRTLSCQQSIQVGLYYNLYPRACSTAQDTSWLAQRQIHPLPVRFLLLILCNHALPLCNWPYPHTILDTLKVFQNSVCCINIT